MYAVVRTGGKQYRVSTGEKLRIEKLTAAVGSELVLDEVLLVGDGQALKVGTPVVKGASVKAKIVAHGLGDKDRKSTRLNSSHLVISYAVFCLKKKAESLQMTCAAW